MKLSRRMIESWCGAAVYAEAQKRVRQGAVLRADVDGDIISGLFAHEPSPVRCKFYVDPSGIVESDCPCFVNRTRGQICVHVAALAISVMIRQDNPIRQQRYVEDLRRAKRMEAGFGLAIKRSPRGAAARVKLELSASWREEFKRGEVILHCAFLFVRDGAMATPEEARRGGPLALDDGDATILDVLEDIDEKGLAASMKIGRYDFLSLLDVCRGRLINVAGEPDILIERRIAPLSVMIDMDRENGELLVFATVDRSVIPEGCLPEYFVELERSMVYHAGSRTMWPLAPTLPLQYHGLYCEPVAIPRAAIMSFFENELPLLEESKIPLSFEPDVSPENFSTAPATPKFILTLRGSPASVSAHLDADYGTSSVPAASLGGQTIYEPSPDDFCVFFTRNLQAERSALSRVTAAGFRGASGNDLSAITGIREVKNILGGLVPKLRRLGWRVKIEGRLQEYFDNASMVIPVVSVELPGGGDKNSWFEVGMKFMLQDGSGVAPTQIQLALNRGDSFVEYGGESILIDSDAIESMRAVFRDCESLGGGEAGRFRLSGLYAPYVQSSIHALDGVDIIQPPSWRQSAEKFNREAPMETESLGELDAVLRPYQKEGVYWMRELERHGFGGIMADEMGLGKTLQTLAWLSLPRCAKEARNSPALIVAPTSLVENWQRECQKFTPSLRCIVMAGSSRHDNWDKIPGTGCVITSYALLRRDAERYAQIGFSAVVLDEAQNIKNRTTQNAQAVRLINAGSRLVLTGTPVENGLADIWSIMDFLMPGYLGEYESFKCNYEIPIISCARNAEEAQLRLRRKLHPFMMRRLKTEVARDLPDKIHKVSYSTLAPGQDKLYAVLQALFLREITSLVNAQGFQKSRMKVLALLLRLRQICCHPKLIPESMRGKGFENLSSGKMEQFFEILDEAIDGGHRMLVFSQFTSMLKILREELEDKGIKYCYLDGATKERMEECRKFNQNPEIPVFLISLKAGGAGLNLTGADMVVHYDPWWNPAVEDQATDRAHRIGQKRVVVSVKLITQDTVEEKVLALQRRKQALIEAAVGANDATIMKSLSWEDIKGLLE